MYTIFETQTICPQCNRPIHAAYEERDGAAFFTANCPEHGEFSALAAESAEDFREWMNFPSLNVPPKQAMTSGISPEDAASGVTSQCPLNCGTCTEHLMTACCVLLDVTQRCNQHCPWCFARAGEAVLPDPALPLISAWYDRLLELGEERPFNIQLSGGEPTVRDDLDEIIRTGRSKGFDYIQLNTNGRRIALEEGYAQTLAAAGLSTVFLQFDGLSDEVYTALRGEPLLDTKLRAIEACRAAGLPVTLVPTIVKGVNTSEIGDLIRFVIDHTSVVKGIHFQPASFFGRVPDMADVLNVAQEPENPGRFPGVFAHKACAVCNQGQWTSHLSQRYQPPAVPRTTAPGSPAPVDDRDARVTMFEVMRQVELQTGGLIHRDDLVPITTGHPLCCFCADFLLEKDGRVTPLTTQAQREAGNSCCCGPGETDELEIIRKDRDFVLRKWVVEDMPEGSSAGAPVPALSSDADATLSLDEAVGYIRRNTFTISGMAFMDESNLDAERLRRCRVQQFTKDGRLIPFCAYNTLYR
jgi:uncharacterized radical SAM superfamily Fe-S cluster-containing enzyme